MWKNKKIIPYQGNNEDPLEVLLKDALAPRVNAPEPVQRAVFERMEESTMNKKNNWKKVVAAAVAVVFVLSAAVYAVKEYLKPEEVVERLQGDEIGKPLQEAFTSDQAQALNISEELGGYEYSLLSMVSGEDLLALPPELAPELPKDETYLVLRIRDLSGANIEGNPLFDMESSGGGIVYAHPVIRGFAPSRLNLALLKGGLSSFNEGDCRYILMSMESIEIFAEQGVKIAICDTAFPNEEQYDFDEKTGLTTAKADYEGINVLLDLPLDSAKVDQDKLEAKLEDLRSKGLFSTDEINSNSAAYQEFMEKAKAYQEELPNKIAKHNARMEKLNDLMKDERFNQAKQRQWEEAIKVFNENPDKLIKFKMEELEEGDINEDLPEYELVDPSSIQREEDLEEGSIYLIGKLIFSDDLEMGLYLAGDSGDIVAGYGDLNIEAEFIQQVFDLDMSYWQETNQILHLELNHLLINSPRFEQLRKLELGDRFTLIHRLWSEEIEYELSEKEEADENSMGFNAKEMGFYLDATVFSLREDPESGAVEKVDSEIEDIVYKFVAKMIEDK